MGITQSPRNNSLMIFHSENGLILVSQIDVDPTFEIWATLARVGGKVFNGSNEQICMELYKNLGGEMTYG